MVNFPHSGSQILKSLGDILYFSRLEPCFDITVQKSFVQLVIQSLANFRRTDFKNSISKFKIEDKVSITLLFKQSAVVV